MCLTPNLKSISEPRMETLADVTVATEMAASWAVVYTLEEDMAVVIAVV